MRFLKHFCLLFIILASSCNQNYLGVGHALKNAASLPLEGLRSAHQYVTGQNHSTLGERTRRAHEIRLPEINLCAPESSDDMTALFEGVRDQLCTCREWGTCTAPMCPCDTLCPNHYGIFRRPGVEPEHFARFENNLAFVNGRGVYEDSRFPMTGGYCWGHTVVNQQLYRLGFFEPEASPPHADGSREWINFYRDIITDIRNNKPRAIPGFSSIQEFTDHPSIQEHLVNNVIPHAWASSAMSITGLRTIAGSRRSMDENSSRRLVDEIRESLDVFNVNPKLLFKNKDDNSSVHIVAVASIRDEGDRITLCMNDSSMPAIYNDSCLSNAIVYPDGRITYSPWYGAEIVSVSIPSHEQSEMIQQQRNLYTYCRNNQENCPL
jgi:hypothetical protein